MIVGFYAFLTMLDIKTPLTSHFSRSLMVFDVFWFLYLLVDLSKSMFEAFTKHYSKALSKEVTKLLARLFKFIVISVGIMSILQVWGINISAFVASLGLGGLAFALAAKDAAANIFGSIAILADKAISVGEWIKVDGVEGIVMDIGMRTTKIKTFENSIITMPNQIIANTKIENYSRRNERRIKLRVGLTYDTPSDKIIKIVDEIKDMLKSNQNISQSSTQIVNFDRFEDSSLSIFIYTFANTSNWIKYLKIKEEVNLNIIKIVENNDAEFAFPSQTIYLQKQDN
jgi:MscS family membrane protein